MALDLWSEVECHLDRVAAANLPGTSALTSLDLLLTEFISGSRIFLLAATPAC